MFRSFAIISDSAMKGLTRCSGTHIAMESSSVSTSSVKRSLFNILEASLVHASRCLIRVLDLRLCIDVTLGFRWFFCFVFLPASYVT